jgi:hypothetical protein
MCNVDQILKALIDMRCPKCDSVIASRGPGYMCTSKLCGWWTTWKTIQMMIRQDNERFWAEYRRNNENND